jgi:hypothetical protein
MKPTKTALFIAAIAFCLSIGSKAQADPLVFSNVVALQDGGQTRVDLFSNEGVILLGPQIVFSVDIGGSLPASGMDVLQLTFTEVGGTSQVQLFRIPLFDTVPPPYTQIFAFTAQGATVAGREVSLRVDILGTAPDFVIPSGPQTGQTVDSYTYKFKVSEPIPEPASIILLGLGLAGLAKKRLRRKAIENSNECSESDS